MAICPAPHQPPLSLWSRIAHDPNNWVLFTMLVIGLLFIVVLPRLPSSELAPYFHGKTVLLWMLFWVSAAIFGVTNAVYEAWWSALYDWNERQTMLPAQQACSASALDATYAQAVAAINPLADVRFLAQAGFTCLFFLVSGNMLYFALRRRNAIASANR